MTDAAVVMQRPATTNSSVCAEATNSASGAGSAVRGIPSSSAAGEGVEDGGRQQIARAVVQSLCGEHTGSRAVGRLDHVDAGLRLYETVESTALGLFVSPCAQLCDDEMRMLCGEVCGGEAESRECSRAVPEHDDVRAREKARHPRVVRIEKCGALAVAGVEMLPPGLRHMGRVDTEDVCAEGAESAGADRAGDHTGEIDHTDAAQRERA